jgi:hypothetical protein
VSLAMGAVDLFVSLDERLVSKGLCPYRAYPVVNTNVLFEALEKVQTVEEDYAEVVMVNTNGSYKLGEDGDVLVEKIPLVPVESGGATLTLPTGVAYDGGKLELDVNIIEEDLGKTQPTWAQSKKNVALSLCGPGVSTSAGFRFAFNIRYGSPARTDMLGIVVGTINRAAGGGASLCKKRKLVSMEDA